MVNAGNPQRIVALHSLEANQGILHRCVHGVTHVQLTGDIGRGHDDGEGLLLLIPLRMEVAALLPHIIDAGFHILRFIDLR